MHGGTHIGGAGGAYNQKNVTTWETTSDRRIKRNIEDNHQGLAVIERIRVRNFEYRLPDEVDPELKPSDAVQRPGIQLGVIAQELQQAQKDAGVTVPNLVLDTNPEKLEASPATLIPVLVKAVQELSAELKAVKAELAALKG